MIHKFDHYKGVLLFFIVTGFLHTAASSVLHAFFSSVTRRQEREWVSKQCLKLRSKVKESFVKLVHVLTKSIYIIIYFVHVTFGHFIPLTVLFSLRIGKYYWLLFVWRCAFCLIFTIQHILTIFFLSEFSFESFIILFVAVFIYRPTATFQRVQRTKLDSESFVNVYQFIRGLYVVFKKNSSIKDLIYPFCLSRCFGWNTVLTFQVIR